MQVIVEGGRCEAAAFLSEIIYDCPLKKDAGPRGTWKMALTLP